MRRKTRDFGRLRLVAAFLFISVLLPKFLNTKATDNLGSFAEGETGIKLCAIIDGGNEDAMRFGVSNDQGFYADVIVAHNHCKTVKTEAANYLVRQFVPQEYVLESVTGGTVSADSIEFIATAEGQYSIIYTNTYTKKPYIHSFGYTGSRANATAVEVIFDANGGTGTMESQIYGLNAQQALTSNTFTRAHYDFNGWNTAADGSGDSYTDGQDMAFATGGEFKLYAQWSEHPVAANVVAAQVNNLGNYEIDFLKASVVSDDIETANGNGVNAYTEDGQTVYYYRGQVDNNNVIWAGKCWKIVRTTATGGTKMIYNGVPNSQNQCDATDANAQITYNGQNRFRFNTYGSSPADGGYMYGTRIEPVIGEITEATFSPTYAGNNVEYNEDTGLYTLTDTVYLSHYGDAETQQAIAESHYYMCLGEGNGGLTCNTVYYLATSMMSDDLSVVFVLPLTGGMTIENAMTQMRANTNNSIAKATVEAWFEAEGLAAHEDDLEDAIFCNERDYVFGPLASRNNSENTMFLTLAQQGLVGSFGSFYGRINGYEDDDAAALSLTPMLDCTNKNDAFTKSDTTKGNAKLTYKTGLITADELIIAGLLTINEGEDRPGNYLSSSTPYWTASPFSYFEFISMAAAGQSMDVMIPGAIPATVYESASPMSEEHYTAGLRPMVSLKAGTHFAVGGTGTATNPYIVE